MGIRISSDDVAAIETLAKVIAHEIVRELAAMNAPLAIVEPASMGHVFTAGAIVVDTERHEVTINDRLAKLKPREFALLAALARNAGKLLSREQLISLAWPNDGLGFESSRTVDVHIRRLRLHLGDASRSLQTVVGLGYKLNDR